MLRYKPSSSLVAIGLSKHNPNAIHVGNHAGLYGRNLVKSVPPKATRLAHPSRRLEPPHIPTSADPFRQAQRSGTMIPFLTSCDMPKSEALVSSVVNSCSMYLTSLASMSCFRNLTIGESTQAVGYSGVSAVLRILPHRFWVVA